MYKNPFDNQMKATHYHANNHMNLSFMDLSTSKQGTAIQMWDQTHIMSLLQKALKRFYKSNKKELHKYKIKYFTENTKELYYKYTLPV